MYIFESSPSHVFRSFPGAEGKRQSITRPPREGTYATAIIFFARERQEKVIDRAGNQCRRQDLRCGNNSTRNARKQRISTATVSTCILLIDARGPGNSSSMPTLTKISDDSAVSFSIPVPYPLTHPRSFALSLYPLKRIHNGMRPSVPMTQAINHPLRSVLPSIAPRCT